MKIFLKHYDGATHALQGRRLAALVRAVKNNEGMPHIMALVDAGYVGWMAPSEVIEDLDSLPQALLAGAVLK